MDHSRQLNLLILWQVGPTRGPSDSSDPSDPTISKSQLLAMHPRGNPACALQSLTAL
jgi:hypothetical protein